MCKPHYDARPKTGRNNLTKPELDTSYALPPGGQAGRRQLDALLNMLQVTNAFGLPLALRLQPIGGN
jgi:hypothetical protein